MKRSLCMLFVLLFCTHSVFARDIKIYADGEEVRFPDSPVIVNDRTLVPVRGIFEHLGAEVVWHDGRVTIVSESVNIEMIIGSNEFMYNSELRSFDAAPKIIKDRTYIPLRAVSELLECEVIWDGESRSVHIYSEAYRGSKNISYFQAYEVFILVNEIRRVNNLPPFQWSEELAEVGAAHAEDMHDREFFAHDNPDGKSPFDRMSDSQIKYSFAAENIARDYIKPGEVVDGWMNSESHRANILNPKLSKTGIGFYGGFWCQEFTD